MVAVPEIDGLTQAVRLSEVATMARELVALVLDVEPDAFDLTVSIDRVGSTDLRDRLAEIARERDEAADLERRLARHTRSLARELAALDVSQRDIGTILGVSHQRAHQLLASSPS
jgi:hypothetical protein